MACGDDLRTQLSRYVDGELAPEERAQIDEHVAVCSPCRELLQIFQKNESLLSNALSTESFGNTVIESVISQIKNEAPPIEAKPFEEGFRFRPVLALAAAALLVVGLIVVLNSSHKQDLKRQEDLVLSLSSKIEKMADQAFKQSQDFEQSLLNVRMQDATQRGTEREMWAYITPQHLVVRSSFDLKTYASFAAYRRAEGERNEDFKKVSGDRRLDTPEFIDVTVVPGQAYVYKFRAYRSAKDEDFVESLPVTMRVPRGQELGPDRSIRVQCIDITVNFKLAKFLLHRTVNGQTFTEEFYIKPGERLGEIRDVPTFGKVDFRTGLTLDKLEPGNQTLTVSYTKALLDKNGKPVTQRWNDGTQEVKTVQEDEVLSIRPHYRALFRTSGSGQADVDLWKGSWIQVRAQE